MKAAVLHRYDTALTEPDFVVLGDAFPGETDGDLNQVRQTFLGKSYQRRQELLIRHLLRKGIEPAWLVQATVCELKALPLDDEGSALRDLYIFSWRRIHAGCDEGQLAVTAVDRTPLVQSEFKGYLRLVAGVRRTADFNGHICRNLLTARNADLPAHVR